MCTVVMHSVGFRVVGFAIGLPWGIADPEEGL